MNAPVEARSGRPSLLRVTWLVVKFGLRRTFNRLRSLSRRRGKPAPVRAATARKRPAGGVLVLVFTVLFLFSAFNQSTRVVHQVAVDTERAAAEGCALVDHDTVKWVDWAAERAAGSRAGGGSDKWQGKLREAFDSEARREGYREEGERTQRKEELLRLFHERGSSGFREAHVPPIALFPSTRLWCAPDQTARMLASLGLILALLSLSIVLFSIVGPNQDLSKTEWTFEWWFTFPVSARGLLLARVLETAFATPTSWFFLFPLYCTIFWCAGYSWFAFALGALAIVYVGVLAGSLRVVVETGLRRFVSLRNVARIQSVLGVVSFLPMTAAVAAVSPDWLGTLTRLANRLPSWALFLPAAPLQMAQGGATGWNAAAWSVLFAAFACATAVAAGGWMLRDGLTTEGGPNQGRHRRAERIGASGSPILGAVARKELYLLFRDRTLFTQAIVLPFVIVGMQFLMNRRLADAVTTNPRHAAAMAFGTAAFVLSTGACNTLVMDAPTLWIYFGVPRPLDRLVREKAVFWSCLAAAIALVVFVALTATRPGAFVAGAPTFLLGLVGVVLNAFVATGIGVLGTNPLETELRRRIQPSMIYLYMLLAGMFAYALYVPSAWAKFAQVVLSSLLAAALWQKVRDHTPFLLDPIEEPPASIAVADGVIAALAFFVLQGLLALLFLAVDCSPGVSLLLAFTGAGLIAGVATLVVFWRTGVPDLFATLGLRRPQRGVIQGVLFGVVGGLAGGLIARGYLLAVSHIDMLNRLREETTSLSSQDTTSGTIPWFALLAVVAAPIFEEFIFRGVLYTGFRRSIGPAKAAVFSAAVFAIVHPAIATLPVFILGVIAALAFERSRSLLSSMAVHMTYNAVVIGFAGMHLT